MRHLGAALVALALTLVPTAALAEGTYVGIGGGPAVLLDDWPTQFRVEEEIGLYVSGAPRGFYLSFAPSQSWGNSFWALVFPLRLDANFDLYRSRDVAFQLGPTGSVGFALSNGFNIHADPDPWFHLSFAFALRLLLADERVALYIRPVGFEFAIGDSPHFHTEAVRYVAAFGVQFYF